MRAILFTAAGEEPGREAKTWTGPRITDLEEVLGYLADGTGSVPST
jgi:hypothetical protein